MEVFTYHTPELTPADRLPDCAIAIDVLRATTTIATALAHGAEAVQAFSNMEILHQVSEAWPADRRLRAGERGGAKVEGCDLGNSPLDCTPALMANKRLFISTTNGTRTLERIAPAPVVLTAAQVNRGAVVDYLVQTQPQTVWLVGSGWEGSYSLEDTACAGAIALGLSKRLGPEMVPGNDETVAALSLFQQWENDLVGLYRLASHGQRLLRLGGDADLAYCADTDRLNVLPIQRDPGVLVAHSL